MPLIFIDLSDHIGMSDESGGLRVQQDHHGREGRYHRGVEREITKDVWGFMHKRELVPASTFWDKPDPTYFERNCSSTIDRVIVPQSLFSVITNARADFRLTRKLQLTPTAKPNDRCPMRFEVMADLCDSGSKQERAVV